MKAADPALVALLESREPFVAWEVYTFTLADGSVVEWASVEVPGQTLPEPSEAGPTLTGP